MKVFIQIIIGLIIATTALAQSVVPKNIPSSGGFYNKNGVSVSFSLGQSVNATFTKSGIMLTQGFQQPSYAGKVLPPPINVTFTVDITNYLLEGNVLDTGGIRIAGNFTDLGTNIPNWNPLSPLGKMQQIGNSNSYTLSIAFPDTSKGKTLYFKFVNTNWGKNEGIVFTSELQNNGCGANDGSGNYNRVYSIPTTNSSYTVCWDKCAACITKGTLPTVSTGTVSFSSKNSVVLTNNNLVDTGGNTVSYKGIVVSSSPNPTLYNSAYRWVSNGSLGKFTDSVQNVAQGNVYYARAYAINARGAGYGSIVSILACPPATFGTATLQGCDSLYFKGKKYTSSTTVFDTLKNMFGCDSVYRTVNITINKPTFSVTNVTACDTFLWNGTVYNNSISTSKIFVGGNSKGCDSTAILNLTIKRSSYNPISVTACGSYTWFGTTYNAGGKYRKVLTGGNSVGCDSIIDLFLTIIPVNAVANNITLSGCGSVPYNGLNYTSSTIVRDTLKTVNGCDSIYNIVNINVTQRVTPTNSISSVPSSTTINGGTNVVFTASISNGGTNPSYQWKKNSNNVGTNSNTYSDSNIKNGDTISCTLTSNLVCLTNSIVNSNNLIFKVPTSITSFTPKSASAAAVITISGYSFTGATAVSFGGVSASSFVVNNDNSITATVAKGASGAVTVTTPAGTASLAGFVYIKPLIDSVMLNPMTIPTSGGIYTNAGVNLSFTIGQTVNNTLLVGNTMLTQGFQQPNVSQSVSQFSIVGNIVKPNKTSLVFQQPATLWLNGNAIQQVNSNFTINKLVQNSNQVIRLTKNNDKNKANGVSTIDVALTQSHILQKSILNSPYKIIAADVNDDGKVTALDIVFMKRFILGTDTIFPKKRLWAFVDSSYSFPNPANPFPYKDSISFTGLNANQTNQTFIGMKLGDVNWDWNANLPKGIVLPTVELSYEFTVEGSKIKVPVYIKNFKAMQGIQYSINFNNKVLKFLGITNKAIPFEFNTNQSSEGMLSMLWIDSRNEVKTIADGTLVFELEFELATNARINEELFNSSTNQPIIHLSNDITEVLAIDGDLNRYNVVLKPTNINTQPITINNAFSVYPNPAKDKLIISTDAKQAQISISNELGKQFIQQKLVGQTTIDVSKLAKGVYFISLISDKGVSTQTFIKE